MHELAPGAEVFFNGTMDAAMGETVGFQTHLDLESLATSPGLWGYLHYPIAARQARVYGLPFLGMTGRFHKSWADFGGLKTFDQLEYEAATIMAAGGGVFVGDQLHPSGVLDPAVYRLIGRVFERVERLEPWLQGVRSAAEVAIVSAPRTEVFGGQPATAQSPEVEGAAQMFLESAVQFDIVDPGADLSNYRLVVLPDGLVVGPALKAELEAHLARGGALLVSGTAGLGPDGLFALDAIPVEYVGPAPTMPSYFRVDEWLSGSSELATDYDYVLYDRASVVRAREGATSHGRLSAALFERTWEHFFSHAQAPVGEPLGETAGAPLLVIGGNVGYLAAPLFRAYRDHDYWPYREVVMAAIRELTPEPLGALRRAALDRGLGPAPGRGRRAIGRGRHRRPARESGTLDRPPRRLSPPPNDAIRAARRPFLGHGRSPRGPANRLGRSRALLSGAGRRPRFRSPSRATTRLIELATVGTHAVIVVE